MRLLTFLVDIFREYRYRGLIIAFVHSIKEDRGRIGTWNIGE